MSESEFAAPKKKTKLDDKEMYDHSSYDSDDQDDISSIISGSSESYEMESPETSDSDRSSSVMDITSNLGESCYTSPNGTIWSEDVPNPDSFKDIDTFSSSIPEFAQNFESVTGC